MLYNCHVPRRQPIMNWMQRTPDSRHAQVADEHDTKSVAVITKQCLQQRQALGAIWFNFDTQATFIFFQAACSINHQISIRAKLIVRKRANNWARDWVYLQTHQLKLKYLRNGFGRNSVRCMPLDDHLSTSVGLFWFDPSTETQRTPQGFGRDVVTVMDEHRFSSTLIRPINPYSEREAIRFGKKILD